MPWKRVGRVAENLTPIKTWSREGASKPEADQDTVDRALFDTSFKEGARTLDPTGGALSDSIANMILHPIDNAPAIGAAVLTAASGETGAIPMGLLAAIGAAGGAGYRRAYNQATGAQPLSPKGYGQDVGDAMLEMTKEGAINGALAGGMQAGINALPGVGNWLGRTALKTPVSIAEDVPNASRIGIDEANKRLVEKAYEKGLRPGTSAAARDVRSGAGGIDAINAQIGHRLSAADAAGARIDPETQVAPVFDELAARYAPGDFSPEDLAAVAARKGEFSRNPATTTTRPIMGPHDENLTAAMAASGSGAPTETVFHDVPPTVANEIKVANYNKVRDSEWGQRSSPGVQAIKAAGGRWSQAIKDTVPGVGALLDDESLMIPLEDALQRAAWRAGNREVIPLKAVSAGAQGDTAGLVRYGLLDRPGAWGTAGLGTHRVGQALAGVPTNLRTAIMEAIKTRIAQMLPHAR